MADSGVPVISQIGQGAATVGRAIGGFISPKPPAPTPPQIVASPTDKDTGDKMQKAEEDVDGNRSRGMAANMLTGGTGLTSNAPVSRNILLGA